MYYQLIERQGQRAMAIRFVALNGKTRTSKTSYLIDDMPVGVTKGNIGALIPKDCVVIDIDSTSPLSYYYVEWLRAKYPNIFITKTTKAGGFHIWFKTSKKIKRDIGLTSVFGWKFDVLSGTTNYITLPDNYEGRRYISGFKSYAELAKGWDEYNVRIADSIFDLIPYVDADPNHKTPLEFTEGERNSGLIEWLGYFIAKGISVECIKKHSRVLCTMTKLSEHELNNTVLSSLAKYENRDTMVRKTIGVPEIRNIVGDDYVSVSIQLCEFIKENDLFGFDEATGLGYCNIASAKGQALTQKEMREKMILYFGDKLYYTSRDKNGQVKKLSRLPTGDRDVIFEEAKQYVKFNSRVKQYEEIPEWDGKERITNFMKDYYECDANPNFTWLLMTAIVGKLKEPDKCYVPFFFDFVGERGVGKSTLAAKLSCGRYTKLSKGRSHDDMFVNVYSENSLIALDDECSVSKTIDYDLWKSIVTDAKDMFSRKFQQPEVHPRSFIIVRTSNEKKTGFAVDERRQIIFESKLPMNECRVFDLPNEFFQQMFAEAKVYYEKYGVYKLTDADWAFMKKQQADSFHTENTYYMDALNYVNWARTKIKSGYFDKPKCWVKTSEVQSGWAVSWQSYSEWCAETMSRPMNSGIFWNQITAIAAKTGYVGMPSRTPLIIDDCPIKYAELFIDTVSTDKLNANINIEAASVLGFFEKPVTKNTNNVFKNVSSNEVATELGATKAIKMPSNGMYKLPEELKWCPQGVREFFVGKQSGNTMEPTTVDAYGLPITYGLGGIHYAIKDYEGDDLMYVDVQSMYPNIMIIHNLYSRAISYKSKYVTWVREREKAKADGDKEKADKLKLKINSVYGLMKADWCTLYDPYMASSIAVTGQVLMTILIGGLVSAGCEIVNANTDGLIIKPNGNWHNICEQWENNTGLKLVYKPIKHLQQANVNNYRATMPDGNVINKGEKFNTKA